MRTDASFSNAVGKRCIEAQDADMHWMNLFLRIAFLIWNPY